MVEVTHMFLQCTKIRILSGLEEGILRNTVGHFGLTDIVSYILLLMKNFILQCMD